MSHFTELLRSYDLSSHKAQIDKCGKRAIVVTGNDDPFEMVKTVLAGQLSYAKTQDDAVLILFALACGTIITQLKSQMEQPLSQRGDDETLALLKAPHARPL